MSFPKSILDEIHCFEHDDIVINSRDEVGEHTDRIRKVKFPTFEIFSSPSVRIGDRAIQNARQEIMAQEDADIFASLDAIGKNES